MGFEPTCPISRTTRFRVGRVTASFATSPLCGDFSLARKSRIVSPVWLCYTCRRQNLGNFRRLGKDKSRCFPAGGALLLNARAASPCQSAEIADFPRDAPVGKARERISQRGVLTGSADCEACAALFPPTPHPQNGVSKGITQSLSPRPPLPHSACVHDRGNTIPLDNSK